MPTEVIPTDVKLAFFNEARHAYGRTALLLSGGAALGFYHVGLIAALLKNNLMPRVISGSSAGSIMAAILGTHTDEELLRMVSTGNGFRNDFIRPDAATVANPIFKFFSGGTQRRRHSSPYEETAQLNGNADVKETHMRWRQDDQQHDEGEGGEVGKYRNSSKDGGTSASWYDEEESDEDYDDGGKCPPLIGILAAGLLRLNPWSPMGIFGRRGMLRCDSDHLAKVIRDNTRGDVTFEEAFNMTGRIINIIVAPQKNTTDPPRLLNYLTAPHCTVWSAATASSAVPGVFEPQCLMVKDSDGIIYPEEEGACHTDGSVE